ncbi:MAG: tetratricopeptide repeat protein [Verrucomicrobiota bacterium]|jgi:predicted negative regulator of RcsB-dependent stress response
MELQDAPATYLFKLWPWFEANRIRIIWGGGVIVVAAGLISFYSWQRDQKEIVAGKALTQVIRSIPRNATASQQADLYLKVSTDYFGTSGGQRALLQGAAMLFAAGRYTDAQAQFQKFLDTYPGSFLAAQAALGVATSLDAQGDADLAAGVYQRIINTYSDAVVVDSARFALAQIDERRGKLDEAANLYEAIVHYNPNGSLGSEAGLRLMELKMKQQSAPPSTAPATPFELNH